MYRKKSVIVLISMVLLFTMMFGFYAETSFAISIDGNTSDKVELHLELSSKNQDRYSKRPERQALQIDGIGTLPNEIDIIKKSDGTYGFTVIKPDNLHFDNSIVIELKPLDGSMNPIDKEESYGTLTVNGNNLNFKFNENMILNKERRSFGFTMTYNISIDQNMEGNILELDFLEDCNTDVIFDINSLEVMVEDFNENPVDSENTNMLSKMLYDYDHMGHNKKGENTLQYAIYKKKGDTIDWYIRLDRSKGNLYGEIIYLEDSIGDGHEYIPGSLEVYPVIGDAMGSDIENI